MSSSSFLDRALNAGNMHICKLGKMAHVILDSLCNGEGATIVIVIESAEEDVKL